MSGLCSVLETLHKSPDSDLESDDNNDNDDTFNNNNKHNTTTTTITTTTTSDSWGGSLQKLPTTPSTSESDLANLSADSDLCRQCQCRAASSRHFGRSPRGRGRSRERGRGSDRESERESDRDSMGGYNSGGGCNSSYNSGYNSDSRPPLPSRSLKTRPSRSRSRQGGGGGGGGGGPSPSPTLTSSPQTPHQHTSSLDTDCSSDQDKCSDSSAADVVSTGGLLRNKRTSRKSKKSVGFAEDPPQELPPPSPNPVHQHPPSPQPPPPPPPHPQGPPSSPLPDRANLFRPISKPSPGPLKANHELLRLIPATSQANPGSSSSSASKDRDFRPVRRPRARSSDSSSRAELPPGKGEPSQTSVLSRVSALEALSQSGVKDSSGDVQDGVSGTPTLRDSSHSRRSKELPKEKQNHDSEFSHERKSSIGKFERRKLLHPRPRSASVDRRRPNGLSVGVTSPGITSSYLSSQISSGSSVTPSPSSTPSPGFQLPSPNFPPPPDSALPQYDEALERIKLLRWSSLQKLPTSPGVSGTCGGRSENRSNSNDGSDDVFTSDDDVRPSDNSGTHCVNTDQVSKSSASILQGRKISSSRRIVLEVLV